MAIDPQAYNDPQTYGRDAGARHRVRVRKACQTCKRRKVKCNGVQPCSNCVKQGIQCTYQFRSQVPTDAVVTASTLSRDVSTSPGMMSTTIAGIGHAGALASAGSAAIGPATPASGTSAVPFAASCVPSPWQTFSSDKYRFHRRYQNVLPFHLGQALLAALPPTAAQQYALKVPRVQCYGWNMSGGHYLGQQRKTAPTQWEWQFDLPLQRGIAEKLMRVYFQFVNDAFSIVHEKVFWQQYHNGFLDKQRSSSDLFAALLYLVMATALRFTQGQPDTITWDENEITWLASQRVSGLEERLFDTANVTVTRLSFEWESFELIQAWLLIASYLRTCHRQTSCWQALGRAIRMCNGMALYLNRFPAVHAAYDECRARNCFWSCFMLDKVISFQMGRYPELPLPAPQMDAPDSYNDTWFSDESIAMWRLSLIVSDCQKRNGEELGIDETCGVRARLQHWVDTLTLDANSSLCARQVFLTYLDVRLTLEVRGLFQLLHTVDTQAVDSDAVFAYWPLDAGALIDLSKQVLQLLGAVVDANQFFLPWWLNLSLLFTVSITSITLMNAGLQLPHCRRLLQQCFDIWHYIEQSQPLNPPSMAGECLWCLKMLGHMCSLRLQLSEEILTSTVGVDHANDSLNKNKFRQFGKVDEDQSAPEPDANAVPANVEEDALMLQLTDQDDLLSHIQWFDQWLDINTLDVT